MHFPDTLANVPLKNLGVSVTKGVQEILCSVLTFALRLGQIPLPHDDLHAACNSAPAEVFQRLCPPPGPGNWAIYRWCTYHPMACTGSEMLAPRLQKLSQVRAIMQGDACHIAQLVRQNDLQQHSLPCNLFSQKYAPAVCAAPAIPGTRSSPSAHPSVAASQGFFHDAIG